MITRHFSLSLILIPKFQIMQFDLKNEPLISGRSAHKTFDPGYVAIRNRQERPFRRL